jgi:hypothetical protein
MRFLTRLSLSAMIVLSGATVVNAASLPAGTAVLYSSSLGTSSGVLTSNGTIVERTTRPGAVQLTVLASGQAAQTTPLLFGSDGTIAIDTTTPSTASALAQAEAESLAAAIATANAAGLGAGTAQNPSYTIPLVNVIPAGQGTPIQTQVSMLKIPGGYQGAIQVSTTTNVPANGNLDPQLFAAKKGAVGPLKDSVQLVITVNIPNGQAPTVTGAQTDTITLLDKNGKPGKKIRVNSMWAFSPTS